MGAVDYTGHVEIVKRFSSTIPLLCSFLSILLHCHGAEGVASAAIGTNTPIKQIAADKYQIGAVTFEKTTRTITFPAVVNMDKGLIEYLIVHSTGKVHESLFRTEVEPYHIHLAMLLLSNTKPGNGSISDPKTAASNTNEFKDVVISVAWNEGAKRVRKPAEDLVFDLKTKSTMKHGPWRYVGSRVVDGTFLAQRDGSIISTIDDPDALVNNSRPGSEDDENWQVHGGGLLAIGEKVEVEIQPATPQSKK
jgi:hypothetical protein